MTISPDVHVLTTTDLEKIKNAAFKRGVDRGRFELGMEAPFETAMQILELGCSLFFGRRGNGEHMDSSEYQEAHLQWFNRASAFVREQKERNAPIAGQRGSEP